MKKQFFLIVGLLLVFAANAQHSRVPHINERLRANDVLHRGDFYAKSAVLFLDTVFGFLHREISKYENKDVPWLNPYTKDTAAHVVVVEDTIYVFPWPRTSYYCVLIANARHQVLSTVFYYDWQDAVVGTYLFGEGFHLDHSRAQLLNILYNKLLVGIVDLPKESWKRK